MEILKNPQNSEFEFVINQNSILNVILLEDNDYVARFSLKDLEFFNNIPVNSPIRFTNDIIIKAIKFGLIFLINYKGEKDKNFAGHERVIYPMVLGKSAKGAPLLRGYHLSGWSVSMNTHTDKIWRMFRTDRILSMTFTGSFFRLAPDGYQMDDKGMRGGIIARADFNEIRKNQERLIKDQKIQSRDDVSIEDDDKTDKKVTINVENTNTRLDLSKIMDNEVIKSIKDLDNLRITFMKNVFANKYIAVLGAVGKPNNVVDVRDEKKRLLGTYKVLDSAIGRDLRRIKNVKGNLEYDLYLFKSKV